MHVYRNSMSSSHIRIFISLLLRPNGPYGRWGGTHSVLKYIDQGAFGMRARE